MKKLNLFATTILTACILCLTFPQLAHALTHGGHKFTLPQLFAFLLVLGWYLFNHFKPQIKELFKRAKRTPK